jgi:hypothetical protein
MSRLTRRAPRRPAGFMLWTLPRAPADLRVKPNFSNRINVIWAVQSLSKKYSGFPK